jgi:hypothetical protein
MVRALLVAVVLAGCEPSSPQPQRVGETRAWSFFGPAGVTVETVKCAGQVQLRDGRAIVSDDCFTGQTNIVLCTNMTAANPVGCTPAAGALTVRGTGDDLISYARLR